MEISYPVFLFTSILWTTFGPFPFKPAPFIILCYLRIFIVMLSCCICCEFVLLCCWWWFFWCFVFFLPFFGFGFLVCSYREIFILRFKSWLTGWLADGCLFRVLLSYKMYIVISQSPKTTQERKLDSPGHPHENSWEEEVIAVTNNATGCQRSVEPYQLGEM